MLRFIGLAILGIVLFATKIVGAAHPNYSENRGTSNKLHELAEPARCIYHMGQSEMGDSLNCDMTGKSATHYVIAHEQNCTQASDCNDIPESSVCFPCSVYNYYGPSVNTVGEVSCAEARECWYLTTPGAFCVTGPFPDTNKGLSCNPPGIFDMTASARCIYQLGALSSVNHCGEAYDYGNYNVVANDQACAQDSGCDNVPDTEVCFPCYSNKVNEDSCGQGSNCWYLNSSAARCMNGPFAGSNRGLSCNPDQESFDLTDKGFGCKAQQAIDYPGEDVQNMYATDEYDCCDKCTEDVQCFFWTFNTSSETCYFKSGKSGDVVKTDTISGSSRASSLWSVLGVGRCMHGVAVSNVFGTTSYNVSLIECMEECEPICRCSAIMYNEFTAECTKFGGGPYTYSYPNWLPECSDCTCYAFAIVGAVSCAVNCTDWPDWTDLQLDGCPRYEYWDHCPSAEDSLGQTNTAADACCYCGGGHRGEIPSQTRIPIPSPSLQPTRLPTPSQTPIPTPLSSVPPTTLPTPSQTPIPTPSYSLPPTTLPTPSQTYIPTSFPSLAPSPLPIPPSVPNTTPTPYQIQAPITMPSIAIIPIPTISPSNTPPPTRILNATPSPSQNLATFGSVPSETAEPTATSYHVQTPSTSHFPTPSQIIVPATFNAASQTITPTSGGTAGPSEAPDDILYIAIGVFIALILAGIAFCLWYWKRRDPQKGDTWAHHEKEYTGPAVELQQPVYVLYSNLRDLTLLKKGNFGMVFLATLNGRKVVLKTAFGISGKDEAHEVVTLFSLPRHKHLMCPFGQCNDFLHPDTLERTSAIVLPFMKNGSIRDYLKKVNGPLDFETCAKFAYQMCLGVKCLHDSGFVHRDIATRNFLLDEEFNVLLCDFGLTRQVRAKGDHYGMSEASAIPFRWSPLEGLQGQFGYPSDVWMLGITFWELLSSGYECEKMPFRHIDDTHGLIAFLRYEMEYEGKDVPLEFPPCRTPQTLRFKSLIVGCCRLEEDDRPSLEEVIVYLKTITSGDKLFRQLKNEDISHESGIVFSKQRYSVAEEKSGDSHDNG